MPPSKPPKGSVPTVLAWRKAIAASDLPATARHVAGTLANDFKADATNAHPGTSALVAGTGLARSTVLAQLKVLEKQGWIICTRKGGSMPGGRKMASVWKGVIPGQLTLDLSTDRYDSPTGTTAGLVQLSDPTGTTAGPLYVDLHVVKPRRKTILAAAAAVGCGQTPPPRDLYEAISNALPSATTPEEIDRIAAAGPIDLPTLAERCTKLVRVPRSQMPQWVAAVAATEGATMNATELDELLDIVIGPFGSLTIGELEDWRELLVHDIYLEARTVLLSFSRRPHDPAISVAAYTIARSERKAARTPGSLNLPYRPPEPQVNPDIVSAELQRARAELTG